MRKMGEGKYILAIDSLIGTGFVLPQRICPLGIPGKLSYC